VTRRFKVSIASAAEDDVLSIHEYIAVDDPGAARRWLDAFRDQIRSLKTFPGRGARIPEAEILGVTYRHLIHGNYRTVYRVDDDRVLIVRVLHGARQLEGLP
jgi:toxin ParE1/3/4